MNATRSLARLAGRTAMRNKLRSLLVFTLIVLLVAAGTFIATIVRSTNATGEDYDSTIYGAADLVIDVGAGDPSMPMSGLAVPPLSSQLPLEPAPDDPQRWLADFDADLVTESLATDYEATIQYSRSWASQTVNNFSFFPRRQMTPQLLVDLDITDPLSQGVFELVGGRVPGAPTEIMMAPNLLDAGDLAIGDEVKLWDTAFTIVGSAVRPTDNFVSTAIATPAGFDRVAVGGAQVTHRFRVDLASDAPVRRADIQAMLGNAAPVNVYERATNPVFWGSPGSINRLPELVSTAVTAALGIQIALIAASAFAVGVRRRIVEFGQLMTAGASAAHIRRLVLIEAVILGVLGALLGTVVGAFIASQVIGSGVLVDFGSRYASNVRWNALDWIGPAVIGVGSAVAAAWWPARTISSLPATAALAGRIPVEAPRKRTPIWGVLAAAAGTLGTIAFTWQSFNGNGNGLSDSTTLVLIFLSIVLMFAGFLSLIGTVLAVAARFADRLPMRVRLVVRNSDRHRSRAWASVAAFVAALAMPILIASSLQAYPGNFSRPDDQIVINHSDRLGSDALIADRNDRFVEVFEDRIGAFVPLEATVDLVGPERFDLALDFRPAASANGSSQLIPAVDSIAVATPDLVAALGISAADLARLDADTALLLGQGSPGVLNLFRPLSGSPNTPIGSFEVVTATHDDVLVDNPGLLLSAAGAARVGIEVGPIGTLFVADGPIPRDVADRVWNTAADSWDVAIAAFPVQELGEAGPYDGVSGYLGVPRLEVGEARDGPDQYQIRWIAIAAATALAALVAIVGAALAAVEMDRDLGSMIATGAPPSIRRWLLGTQTAYHLFIAAALGLPLAVLLFWAATRAESNRPSGLTLPWGTLTVVGVGIPLLVGVLIAVMFPSGKPAVSRRLS